MKKIDKIITVIIFSFILVMMIVFFFLKKEEYSENEFRYLAKMPDFTWQNIINKKYNAKLEEYLTDHFPMREEYVSLKTKIFMLTGQRFINGVYLGKDGYLLNKFNYPRNLDRVVSSLNSFKDNNPDVSFKLMFVPTSISINSDKLPLNALTDSEKDAINYLYRNIKMPSLDVYSALENAQDDYLYYKTDHHWTMKGAYEAYKLYCEESNLIPLKLSDFTIKVANKDFLGTTYSKVFYFQDKDFIYTYQSNNNFIVTENGKVTNSLYDESFLKGKDKYSYYLGGNKPILKIKNQNLSDGSSLLIIKDSYANSFAPLIANNYEEVHLIDPRYANISISEYLKENNINDVLILYNINTLETDIGISRIR